MSDVAPLLPEPMEARLVEALPPGDGWQYEPKWDGFRCLARREAGVVTLVSKSGKSLARFFPEILAMLGRLACTRFLVDGELILPRDGALSFDALQARLHPAESRIRKLAAQTPAQLMLFDCLARDGVDIADRPLSERREALERLQAVEDEPSLLLSPRTLDAGVAADWLDHAGGALDGIVAKRLDEPYHPGERAMLKIKVRRSADCVVGGFRYDRAGRIVASLLLGLYDAENGLNHVGFTSTIPAPEKADLTRRLEKLIEPPGFTGRAPGGQSRWTTERSAVWSPLRPELVVEVLYDQVTGDRFRHGTRVLRWRPDKAPRQCQMDQLTPPLRPAELAELLHLPTSS